MSDKSGTTKNELMMQADPDMKKKASHVLLSILIVSIPFALHWTLVDRRVADIYYEYTSLILYLSDIALLIFFTSWLLMKGLPRAGGPLAVTLPLVLITVEAAVHIAWSIDPVLTAFFAVRLLLLLALYVTLVQFQPGHRTVMTSFAIVLGTQSVLALMQFILQSDLGMAWIGEVQVGWYLVAGARTWLRAYGLTPHPNILGGILAGCMLICLPLCLTATGRSRLLYLIMLGCGAAGLFVTFSRTAWMGCGVGMLVFFIAIFASPSWRNRYARSALLCVAIIVITICASGIRHRQIIVSHASWRGILIERRSVDERRTLIAAAMRIVLDSKWCGTGAGTFSQAVEPLVRDDERVFSHPVHNVPLLLAAETGVIGGVSWIWLMLAPLAISYRSYRRSKMTLYMLGISCALLALAITDLFDFYSWGWQQGRLLRWTLLGLWGAAISCPTAKD